MAERPMIAVERVTKRFGPVAALSEVSAAIRPGEFFSLLGPSGCGKTTLLRIIGGFDEPSEGLIRIDGQDMAGVPANLRPTNMVFQNYAIFPHLHVAENVAYGLRRLRLGRAEEARRVEAALGLVRLQGLGGRGAHQLSGGQRQRVALARALVLRPKVLLLDEPLSALDKKLREEMQVELRRLQKAVGITFVLVTHDQYEALSMSDRVAVMFAGRIAQIAAPQEIYQRPRTREVADFLGAMNFLAGEVLGVADGVARARVPGFGEVGLRLPDGFRPDGAVVAGIRPERLRVLWKGEEAARMVRGRVTDRHYFGEVTHLEVLVEGLGSPLEVAETNDFGADEIPVGAEVRLGFDPDAFVGLAG
ncbi:MAG TPA: ABC transporter ATP-binding protein [Paracoccaceae bacterium]|nr:ABC transporter ATP-binding protein [Paracoccaceae bacterium]